MNVLAQIFGALALLLLVISYQQVVRKKFLFLQIFANIFYSLQYFVLNAYSAVMTTFITIVELFIFHNDAEKNKKTSILGFIGIVCIVVMAFFVANFIHNSTKEKVNNSSSKKQEEEILKIDGKKINFKSYRVDQSFFLNVPDSFIMLDEATLKSKYN